jgi:hypothetical protein
MKIIQIFLFETDFSYEHIRHKLLFIYKKILRYALCNQLRIFQKEIKSTLNHEMMHILVWMHLKVFLKLKKP